MLLHLDWRDISHSPPNQKVDLGGCIAHDRASMNVICITIVDQLRQFILYNLRSEHMFPPLTLASMLLVIICEYMS